MDNPFNKLQEQRNQRIVKEQEKRDGRSNDLQLRKDKRRLLTLDYSTIVVPILQQLRDSIYPGLMLEEDSWECKWYIYRPINQGREKEIILSVTLKLDAKLEPKYFLCIRNTGKLDFRGGPQHYAESESLSQEELIKSLNIIHPSDTV
jgi:hypothetical protein